MPTIETSNVKLSERSKPRRKRLCLVRLLYMACATAIVLNGSSPLWAKAAGAKAPEKGRLITSIDCTQEFPTDKYFGHGDVRVVESKAGRYREAEGKPLSRFGYRFTIEHIGKPHMIVVRYPDDKRRYMCMMNGTCYDLTTGVYTDFSQPTSGKMLEIRRVFWPRWKDCSVVFMTWGNGEPAAVADIQIYELDGLAALDVPGDPNDGTRREFGVQYEDPCGTGFSEGAMSKSEWIERVSTYARHTGQKRFVYPIVWYHGPHYPSQREPCDDFDCVAGPDRKQYIRWTTQPADWVADMLKQFEKDGLQLHASLTLMRLGSLMKRMNIDLESIKAGKDTYNNMLFNNQVQAGTHDWTPIYNVLNFPKQVKGTLGELAYGERGTGPYGGGPMFNPLHPTVQEAIVGLAEEIAQRYKGSPAFKGISFNMWHSTILWYGSINSGYDDYTVGMFEKETGIKVPVDGKAPDRFSKRHQFLVGKQCEKWLAWRCKKIRELNCRIRDVVVAARPDLRVTYTVWPETMVPALLGQPRSPAQQLYARKSLLRLCREAGFDPTLYHDEAGIDVDLSFTPSRDRDCHGQGAASPPEWTAMFRDHDFLDAATLNGFASNPRSGAFIFDCWVEAWGKHKWFACEKNDAQAKELAVMSGKPAEGIFRMNSTYPKDGFWWDSQWRITPPFQAGDHFLEPYAHSVAELDALRVTRGGLFLDKAHGDQIRRFALAYRALPAKKFETVGKSTDPVAVRTLVSDGRRYVYLVNREYYPVSVELQLANPTGKATDLATGQAVDAPATWRVALGPYDLRSFSLPKQVEVKDFSATASAQIVAQLAKEVEDALATIDRLQKAGKKLPTGTGQLMAGLKVALKDGRWAWLRRALNSYPMRKCKQLCDAKG